MTGQPKMVAKAWMLRKPTGGVVREYNGDPTIHWRKSDALRDLCDDERVIRVVIVEETKL